MEVVQFLIQITLFFWSLSSAIPAVASKPSLAKPSCPTDCGTDTISIPYPFGIGAGCFMNEWFEITCDNSTNNFPRRPIPRLNHASLKQLEVLELSMDGTLSVRNPITFFSDCGTGRPLAEQAPNLTGSPFVFSKRNRLVSVSCGGITWMKLMNGSTGCLSTCGDKGDLLEQVYGPDTCNGINCCQTTIPGNLTYFNTSFQEVTDPSKSSDTTSGSGSCKYAFLVDEAWVVPGPDLRYLVGVPGVLEWNWSQYTKSEIYGTASTTIWDANLSTVCTSNNSCSCANGLEGNPYVVDGCQDIDECKDPNRCGPGKTCRNTFGSFECQSRFNVAIIVISCIVGLLFIHIGAWWSHKVIMKRKDINRKQKFFQQNGGFLLEQQLSSGEANVDKVKLFSAEELEKATDLFSVDRILGQGGQGTVYKGMLANGRIVAVKKSKSVVSGDEVRQFINEIVILSQVIQKNVVKLMGCCLETEVPLLVYEFIQNGTLSHYIQHQNEEFPLTWEMRLQVATEVAGALSYLHSAVSRPIYHRDIKSSNILLDDKYRAKVADFGTSRSVAIDKTHLTMTQVNGTFGYLDPEYFQTSQFTDKSDVYSYGVVLVELLTGRKPIFKTDSQEPMSLSHYFLLSMDENRLFDILDARVVKDARKEEIMVVANLAKSCLNLNGKKRPTMKEVEAELQGIQLSLKDFDVQQNFDVDHVQTRMNEVWDVDSASTHEPSTLFSSPFDVEPLLFIRTE